MLETLLGLQVGVTLADLGVMTALVTIVVQVLKSVLPKKFPTKALTVIIALAISVTLVILSFGAGLFNIVTGVIVGFIVAFISMNGFDSLREIWQRFQFGLLKNEVEETNDDEEDVETVGYTEGETFDDDVDGEG